MNESAPCLVVPFMRPFVLERQRDIERRRLMNKKISLALVVSALVAGTLAGCSSPAAQPTSAPAAKAPAATSVAAKAASNSLGNVIVDGSGHTAYFFDKDTANSGKSACAAGCSATWPAITTSSKTPTVSGVSGTIGTIPAGTGKFQVTVDGMPIYTYSGDSATGDTNGQGIGGIWWVAGSDGKEIKTAASGY
jgi:predicted lipoprotein with Yx(FWY)xxD motif